MFFGTRGITLTKEKGNFHCPECSCQREYARKRVRRFFTLYFIPLIPLDNLGEYIECKACKNSFRESILDYRPQASEADFDAEYQKAIKRVGIQMMLAEGKVDNAKVKAIKELYANVSGIAVSDQEIKDDIIALKKGKVNVSDELRKLSPYLNDNGKEIVIKSALCVAAIDDGLKKKEQALLGEIASSLDMSPSHVKGVIADLANNE